MHVHVAATPARRRSARVRILVGGLIAVAALPLAARAQLPGLPLLQNAFGSSGITFAVNGGNAAGGGGQTYALAAGFGASRFLAAAGAGASGVTGNSAFAYGVRVAVPVFQFGSGAFGVAGFAGFGGTSSHGATFTRVPLGATIGWRHAIGDRRGISAYLAPNYSWYREGVGDTTRSAGRTRLALGVDFGVTPSLGVTLGFEGGQNRTATTAGPSGSSVGLGVSWVWRRW